MSFVFGEDSVLLSQPLLLDLKQRRFLVGVRFAVESLELSRTRLWNALERWHTEGNVTGGALSVAGLFTDVWSIVDNARRLQRLLWKMPFAGEISFAKAFVDRWPTVKKVRDAVQHVEQDFLNTDMLDNHVYGQLCWIDMRFRISDGKVHAYVVPAGPQANRQLNSVQFPAAIPIDTGDSIDSVILQASGVNLNIAHLLIDIEETIQVLEARIGEALRLTIASELAAHPERAAKLKLNAKITSGFRLEISPKTT